MPSMALPFPNRSVSGRSVHFSFPLARRTHALANHPVDAEREEHDNYSGWP